MRTKRIELPNIVPMESHDIFLRINASLDNLELNCAKDVVLIIDDYTRPCTVQGIIFEAIASRVGYERVVVIVASGLHRASSYQEVIQSLGNGIKKARLYSHNPMAEPSPFFDGNYIVMGVNTVLPHLHTEFSNCGKLLCPGLSWYLDIKRFHEMGKEVAKLSILSKAILFDVGFDVYINYDGDVIDLIAQSKDEDNIDAYCPKKEYYEVLLPSLSKVAVLYPAVKKIDFQQTMNVLNIMKYSSLVCEDGTICIVGDTPDGIGTHYLYQQPNGIVPVKYDRIFNLRRKRITFVMPNVSERAIQEYFEMPIQKYDSMEEFRMHAEYIYGSDVDATVYYGADIMIGRKNA